MRKLFCLLLMLFLSYSGVRAAVVLASYSGGGDPKSAPYSWNSTSTTTNVTYGPYNDAGREVWRIYDPGIAAVSGGTPSNFYYQKTWGNDTLELAISQGWKLSATIKIPDNDPTTGVDWSANSNAWIGFIHPNPENTAHRIMWAFQAGRTATGQTRIAPTGFSPSLPLTSGYHDLEMIYDPILKQAMVIIDGIERGFMTGTAVTSSGSMMVYWGDNSSQSAAQDPRAAYFDSIQFMLLVPEPKAATLGCMGIALLLLRRGRKPQHA